jgi:hypothetical protein
MHIITPIQLEILLKAYYHGDGYVETGKSTKAEKESCVELNIKQMLTIPLDHDMPENKTFWFLTDKGHYYIEHILSTPFPISQWIVMEVEE